MRSTVAFFIAAIFDLCSRASFFFSASSAAKAAQLVRGGQLVLLCGLVLDLEAWLDRL